MHLIHAYHSCRNKSHVIISIPMHIILLITGSFIDNQQNQSRSYISTKTSLAIASRQASHASFYARYFHLNWNIIQKSYQTYLDPGSITSIQDNPYSRQRLLPCMCSWNYFPASLSSALWLIMIPLAFLLSLLPMQKPPKKISYEIFPCITLPVNLL